MPDESWWEPADHSAVIRPCGTRWRRHANAGPPCSSYGLYSAAAPRDATWRSALAEAAVAEVKEAFTEALGAMPTDLSIQVVVRDGRAGAVLVAAADRDSDLLVIGGSGTHRWTYPWSATVARYCARHASCPVTIAPPPAMARCRGVRRLARAVAFAAEEFLPACDSTGPASTPQP